MPPAKRAPAPVEEPILAAPTALPISLVRAECLFDVPPGQMTVRVVYKNADDYAENATSDQAKIEALPGHTVQSASLGPTGSTGLAPWPLLGEWILFPNRL